MRTDGDIGGRASLFPDGLPARPDPNPTAIGVAHAELVFVHAHRSALQVSEEPVHTGLGIFGMHQLHPVLSPVKMLIHGERRRVEPHHGENFRAAPHRLAGVVVLPDTDVGHGDDGAKPGLAAGQCLRLGHFVGHITQHSHHPPRHTLNTGQRHLCREHAAICPHVLPMKTLRLACRSRRNASLSRVGRRPTVGLPWRGEFDRPPADNLLALPTEHPLDSRVDVQDHPIVDDDDAVVRALHHGLELAQPLVVGMRFSDVDERGDDELAIVRVDQAAIHLTTPLRPVGCLQTDVKWPGPTLCHDLCHILASRVRLDVKVETGAQIALSRPHRVTEGTVPRLVPVGVCQTPFHQRGIRHRHRCLLQQRLLHGMASLQGITCLGQTLIRPHTGSQFIDQFIAQTHEAGRQQHQADSRVRNGREVPGRPRVDRNQSQHGQGQRLPQKRQGHPCMPHARLAAGSRHRQRRTVQ